MLLLNGLSVALKAMGRSFKSNLMFIYNQPYVLLNQPYVYFKLYGVFYANDRSFIHNHAY